MVCYCLDLRGDSKVGKFLSNKIVSVLTGFVQLAIWFSSLMNFIIQPPATKEVLHNMDTASIVMTILLTIMLVAFSVLLLFGLFKGREGFIMGYLIFNMVISVLFVLSFFVTLFTNPKGLGVTGFLGFVIILFLNVLFFFIIRNYYLSLTSKRPNNPA